MKRSLIIFACMSFSFIFPAEHNGQEIIQRLNEDVQLLQQIQQHIIQQLNEDEQQLLQQLRQHRQQLLEQRNAAMVNEYWRKLLEKRRIREAIVKKGIALDTVSEIRGPFSDGEKKYISVEITEEEERPGMSFVRKRGEQVFFKEHTRRSDKYKKPVSVQYPQHHSTNNRADRLTHAQCNNKSGKRKY